MAQPLALYANSWCPTCKNKSTSFQVQCEVPSRIQSHICMYAHTSSRARVQFRDSFNQEQIGRVCHLNAIGFAGHICGVVASGVRQCVCGCLMAYIYRQPTPPLRQKLCMPHDSRRWRSPTRSSGSAKRHIFESLCWDATVLARLFRLGIVWRNDGR